MSTAALREDRVLVGRDDETAWLARGWARARDGRATRLLVTGPAGIGKSALVDAFADGRDGAVAARVEADADPAAGAFLDQLARALGAGPAPSPDAAPTPLLEALGTLQDRGPVVLVLHDLQDVDEASAVVLARLVRRLHHDRVLVVATVRDTPSARWARLFADGPDAGTRELGGLDEAGVRALVHARRPGRWSAAVVARLHRGTAGHPLHLATLLQELPEDVLRGTSPLPAPRRLVEEVRAVVAGLDGPARAVLAVLAVLDQASDAALVGRLAGVGVAERDRAVDVLVAEGLVESRAAGPRPLLRVHHPLVRGAVHDGLSPDERRRRHLDAAAALGGRAALEHRVAAGHGEPDETLAADLETSAAAEPTDHRDAATRLLAAADVSPTGPAAERRLLAGALRLVEAYDTDRLAALAPRIREAGPGPERAVVLGFLLSVENHPDAALHLQQALDDPGAPPEVRALAGVRLGLEHVFRGRGAAAARAAAAVDDLTTSPTRAEQGIMLQALGRALEHGPAAGLALLDDVVAPALSAEPVVAAGMLHLAAGDPAAARDSLTEGIARVRRGAACLAIHRAHVHLAEACFHTGRWDRAEAEAEIALVWFADGDRTWAEATAHAVAALVPAARGDADRAGRHLADARAVLGVTFSPQGAGAVALAETVLARSLGDPARALRAVGRLAEAGGRGGMLSGPWATWRLLHVEALLDTGDERGARRRLRDAPRTGAPLGFALGRHRLQGRLAEAAGDPAGAASSYRAGLDLAARHLDDVADACPLALADLHAALGTLLGDTGDGRAHRDAARGTFVELGARPRLDRLELAGARDGGPPDPSPLTPRERQVAELAARGLTSREVAASLWVTPKAVDFHLGNVYAKLGISSRRQLRGRTFA
ncbi:DUF2791 family P-loop domain-containing protein [Actinomycetospora chlora]|uniref:DUF2791 family P-loop domain-containing protein n=1 Tax=Actinomycetospora chlora TaxID=663608 RepID=A0ABP9BBD1_9PSEU